ncbi:hypothetical protein QQ045_032030 [Rhodiola kirilowii]
MKHLKDKRRRWRRELREFKLAVALLGLGEASMAGDSLSPLDDVGIQNQRKDPDVSTDSGLTPLSSSASRAIDFLTLCRSLKTTKRTGWINNGIKGPESIADHMYRMGLMSLIVGDLPAVDRERCIKMAIVHDIAEAIVGDIAPSDGISKEEKSRREEAALEEMCKVLGEGTRSEEIKELWREYEDNSSKEANLVKDFDKVEMILQALEYEKEQGKVLDSFFQSTAGKFQTDVGKAWATEVNARRTSSTQNK